MPDFNTIRRYTPLGLRFWDAATETRVVDGLKVQVWPESAPRSVAHGQRTVGGDVAVHGISGLEDVERTGNVDAVPLSTYTVRVQDPMRRFVPTAFSAELPQAERGFYTLAHPESPPDAAPPGIYLFSAPTRRVPTRLAVVQASLRDAHNGAPAAFAAMYVEHLDPSGDSSPDEPPDDRVWVGVADAAGAVQVVFPYPQVPRHPRGSPPGEGHPLARQEWALRVRVKYTPAAHDIRPGTQIPTLPSVFGQSPATLVADASTGGSESPTLDVSLRYRTPAVVRTAGLGPEEGLLLVLPGTSPP